MVSLRTFLGKSSSLLDHVAILSFVGGATKTSGPQMACLLELMTRLIRQPVFSIEIKVLSSRFELCMGHLCTNTTSNFVAGSDGLVPRGAQYSYRSLTNTWSLCGEHTSELGPPQITFNGVSVSWLSPQAPTQPKTSICSADPSTERHNSEKV